ncbi:MAG: hypothetical protein H0W28_12270 [Pyrinomonadaceae bacterium]|nr:hypothetical protein [Pyrinomonadaceae bacterium]
MSEATEKFLMRPTNDQRKAILQYSPRRQVDLYLWALLAEHPPDLGLADSVASNGAKIVPALKQRLIEGDDDMDAMHLIDVFVRMHELGSYPIASDRKTMRLLEKQVGLMNDAVWKRLSAQMLDDIRDPTRRVD